VHTVLLALPSSPAGEWHLNGGTQATDTSNNNNHGTLVGNTLLGPSGKILGAATFDGADDYIQVATPTDALKPAGAFAIAAWILPTGTDTNGAEVVSMGDNYALRIQPGGQMKTFFYDGVTWRTHTAFDVSINVLAGGWHHVVGQYDGAKLEIYVDGVLSVSPPFSGPITYSPNRSFHIGRHGNGSGAYDFKGQIDAVRVYGRALTAAEVAELRAEPPRGQWTLDENSGPTAADTSGNGNHGTLVGGATWEQAGKIGSAVTFNGNGAQIVVSAPSDALKPANAFAISAWIKTNDTDDNGGEIASMGDRYALRVQPGGQIKTFFFDGTTWQSHTGTNASVLDNQWHHVVGQYTGGRLEVYVDGAPFASPPITGTISYGAGNTFSIGRHGNGGQAHDFFGLIDAIRVYDHALSTSEIDQLFTEGGPTIPPTTNTPFDVLTWNLRKCRGTDDDFNCTRIADHIKNMNPDVALLTAVLSQSDAETIQGWLNTNAPTPGGWKLRYGSAGGEGQAILTKHAMANSGSPACVPGVSCFTVTTADCPGATEPENQIIVQATITIDGSDINFFAVDQQHGTDNWAVRKCQAERFRQWAHGFRDLPRIAGGDFNAIPTDWGIRTWVEPVAGEDPQEPYSDGWVSPDATQAGYDKGDAQIGNTLGEAQFGRTKSKRIDYVIYTAPTLKATAASVFDRRVAGTTCYAVSTVRSDNFIGGSSSCNRLTYPDCTCQYIDDDGVRPTDHIPLMVRLEKK
jgi:endonuclease/exonuclease/phosphatase family metal-dependent hydrolase